jgi:lysyl-tRNA synthetase class 2
MDAKELIPPVITPEHTETNEHEIRLAKIKHMQEEGVQPWPWNKPVSTTTAQALKTFAENPEDSTEYKLAGRLVTRRDHGKTFFCHIQDRAAKLQLYIKKDEIGEQAFENFKKYIDLGDIVWVRGTLFITKTGEPTLKVVELELLSKCLHPLPEKFHGLTDVEQRYRQRYLDLISNPESREKFKKRSGILQAIRQFLQQYDFLEVETPMLHPIPGGAAARPFVTHHNAYGMELYLRIAPELYLKRLVIGGFERVFEINRNFRNEGVSTRHNPEFTMLEFYMAYGDYLDGMRLTEELIQDTVLKNFETLDVSFQGKTINFTAPFKKLTVEESLVEIGGLSKEQISENNIDALMRENGIEIHGSAKHGAKLFALFEHFVEAKIVQPTFIVGYPIEISPLAKRDENNPNSAARFELFICGMEFANGFSELNDPFDQAERFKGQAEARASGDQEAHYYDADYIKALEYGLPPTVGVGIGIDRLIMLLTDTSTIKDVILFPTLKSIHE